MLYVFCSRSTRFTDTSDVVRLALYIRLGSFAQRSEGYGTVGRLRDHKATSGMCEGYQESVQGAQFPVAICVSETSHNPKKETRKFLGSFHCAMARGISERLLTRPLTPAYKFVATVVMLK